MIDMTHHRDDRGAPLGVALRQIFFSGGILNVFVHKMRFITEFIRNQRDHFMIQTLIDGHHEPQLHALGNDLRG